MELCEEEIILDYILSSFVKATEIGRKTYIYMGEGGKGGGGEGEMKAAPSYQFT